MDTTAAKAVINTLTRSPELENTIEFRHEASGPGKVHGKGLKVVIEGHDLSHLCSEMDMTADSNSDVMVVRLSLVALRPI